MQSYEGNVNSHTRMQLGVDPFERFVMSGIIAVVIYVLDRLAITVLRITYNFFQEERTPTCGFGVSSLVNCSFKINSLMPSSQPCAGVEKDVGSYALMLFYFLLFLIYAFHYAF